jgi:hypothetical protein
VRTNERDRDKGEWTIQLANEVGKRSDRVIEDKTDLGFPISKKVQFMEVFFEKKVMGKRISQVIADVLFILIAFTILIVMEDVIFLIIIGITTLAEVISGMQTAIRGW